MRKIILHINSTFNGVVTGDPAKDKTNFLAWTDADHIKAGSECLLETMQTVDTMLLGRGTYEDLGRMEKWPGVKNWPGVDQLALDLGDRINNTHKFVVTGDRPLDELSWGEYEAPQQITGDNVLEQIRDLKNRDGGDIIIFGSPTLVRSLTDENLIDEYHFQVAPVVVTYGDKLFDGIKNRKDFDLIEVKGLEGGSFVVKYKPAEAPAE